MLDNKITRLAADWFQVPCCRSRLNSGDVFILDQGTMLYQWNGSGSNKDERFKAMQFLINLKSERGSAKTETLEEADTSDSVSHDNI